MTQTTTQGTWRDEVQLVALRTMRGGPHAESDPFVATVKVRDDNGAWQTLSVTDEGTGGGLIVDSEWKKGKPGLTRDAVNALEKRIERLHKEQVPNDPKEDAQFADIHHNFDVIIEELVANHEEQKIIDKKSKTKVVGRRGAELCWFSCLPTPANIERIKAKYPGIVILNKTLASDADQAAATEARTMKWVWTQIGKGCLVIKRADGTYTAFHGPVTPTLVARVKEQHPGCTVTNPGV